MWSPDRRAGSGRARWLAFVGLAAALAAGSGCTVRPLYGQAPAAGTEAGTAALLSSIAIAAPSSRHEQEVYNHLIFLFGGGQGQPAQPAYSLDIDVSSKTQSAALVQVADEDEPTAGTVTLVGTYRLASVATPDAVHTGTRQATASFDSPRQQFAVARAERDAQNRAARELAEFIRLAVAQELETLPAQ